MLADGDAKTACQMACSADAIVFGNVKDPKSAVVKMRNENPKRTFHVLEQLHVLPNITYLAKLRNTNEMDPNWVADNEPPEKVHEETHNTVDTTGHLPARPENPNN